MLLDVVIPFFTIIESEYHNNLSFLSSLKVVTDKMVITCERDEKIRVSHFPNGYNINNFCLGHTEFVTCIALVSDDLLLSGSGVKTV